MTARYTTAEKRQRAALVLRGSRQALAGDVDPRIDARIEAIDQNATDRWQREAAAALALVERRKGELAVAKAAERATSRTERDRAKRARKTAEEALKRAEKAAAPYLR